MVVFETAKDHEKDHGVRLVDNPGNRLLIFDIHLARLKLSVCLNIDESDPLILP